MTPQETVLVTVTTRATDPEAAARHEIATDNSAAFLARLVMERMRQVELFGPQEDRTGPEWSSLLAEETGEVAKAINDLEVGEVNGDPFEVLTELVQVGALALAFAQYVAAEYGIDFADVLPTGATRDETSRFEVAVLAEPTVKAAPLPAGAPDIVRPASFGTLSRPRQGDVVFHGVFYGVCHEGGI